MTNYWEFDFLIFENVSQLCKSLGQQIKEEEYREKCGGGPPPGDKCPEINGIERVNTSCAEEKTPIGGKCKLECEESGVALGKGNEMYGNLVCEMKDGGVSFDNISMYQ